MTGFIKVEAVNNKGEDGLLVECKIEDMTMLDRLHVMYSVMRGLHADEVDLRLLGALIKHGVMEDAVDMQPVTEDEAAKAKSEQDSSDALLEKFIQSLFER